MPKNSNDYYKNLKGFNKFSDVTDISFYRPLPDDWCVVLADITGSTKAINEGRYKDVNMMGAACITSIINALPGRSIPYVFGGDGATLAVPVSDLAVVKHVLDATRRLTQNRFSLDLRAGIVPIGDIRDSGADVLVAKFDLSPGNSMAMLTGGGVQLVDTMIKTAEGIARYQVPFLESDEPPDLEGLSCRWEQLKSCRGTMMSMLIYATGKTHTENLVIYREVLEGVKKIFKSDPKAASPVSAENSSRGCIRVVTRTSSTSKFVVNGCTDLS